MGDRLDQQLQENHINDGNVGSGNLALLDPEELIENTNQGLETAATTLDHHVELDDDDSGDYFTGALEEAGSTNGQFDDGDSGPFDDPLLADSGTGDGISNNNLESNSDILDIEYEHHDITSATSANDGVLGGGGDGDNLPLHLKKDGVVSNANSNGLNLLQGVSKTGHRHELHDGPTTQAGHSLVGGLIWALVIVHVLLLVVLIAAWWRQKRSKDPTMRSLTPGPPQKVGCSYDMDKSFSIPKIELGNLPIKALKTLKQAKA